MARKCDACGKQIRFGHNVSHSKQHTRRSWLPNIQPVTIVSEGKEQRINLCTRCIRTRQKQSN